MRRISVYVFAISMLLLQSCIKDELQNCPKELLLRFRYTLNNQYMNKFDSEVDRVVVYVFDTNGKYVDRFSEEGDQLTNDYVMRLPLPEGKYNVVVHGGNLSTYSTGELNHQVNTLNPTLRKGITDIADFRAELNATSGEGGYLYPVTIPGDFYAGLAVNAISTTRNQEITDVELIKDTKKIKVIISGTSPINAPLDVHIIALDGRYTHDNSIDINHLKFKYIPISTSSRPDETETDLKMMRLVKEIPSMLVIRNSVTQEILYNENMIDLILSTRKYVSQADLDREEEFVFHISIVNNVGTSVSVNGWKVTDIKPDL